MDLWARLDELGEVWAQPTELPYGRPRFCTPDRAALKRRPDQTKDVSAAKQLQNGLRVLLCL